MIFKIKYIFAVLVGSMLLLSGCGDKNSVSLEEALVLAKSQGISETETMISECLSEFQETKICVYVCGAVVNPGVYELAPGSRIVSAIDAAGGFVDDSATEAVNLAEYAQDGMQIIVPTKEQEALRKAESIKQEEGLVNLNTASVAELCSLSGIGEAKAEAILAYRTEIGAFSSIEQLKEVAGIGENLFNQIKSSIYIE